MDREDGADHEQPENDVLLVIGPVLTIHVARSATRPWEEWAAKAKARAARRDHGSVPGIYFSHP
jgi:hypothetical protein